MASLPLKNFVDSGIIFIIGKSLLFHLGKRCLLNMITVKSGLSYSKHEESFV
jgi:hypothetical protein